MPPSSCAKIAFSAYSPKQPLSQTPTLCKQTFAASNGIVAQIAWGNSSRKSSMVAGCHAQQGPGKYKTKNWSAYSDALKRHESPSIWFSPEMTRAPTAERQKRTK